MGIREVLSQKIQAEGGSLSFAEFVDIALYHPEFGYYSKGPRIGREGDFYTSPTLHPIFGWTLARWIHQVWNQLGWPLPLRILELGPGEGYLALDILTWFQQKEIPVTYGLVERSPTLTQRQREVLQGKPVTWFTTFSDLPSPIFVVSNELFDAFPFFRVQWTSSGWQELRVVEKGGAFSFQAFPLQDPELQEFLQRYRPWVHEGQILDVSPQTYQFALDLFAHLKQAVILTIDYGDRRPSLLRRFPQGSLMVYHQHRVLDHPFENPGNVDITYHIDFDLLIEAGETQGVEPVYFKDQGIFLMDIGILEILEELEQSVPTQEEEIKARLAVKTLVYRFGRSHQVLVQAKGIHAPLLQELIKQKKRRT